jgi:chromosome segregation ATPase
MSDDWWATPDKVQSVLREEIKIRDDLIATLTEQLEQLVATNEAARADAKEAEAYAKELERDLKTCRMAQVVMDNTVAELELKSEWFEEEWVSVVDKLNKAVEGLREICGNGDATGRNPQLMANIARATLAEIELVSKEGEQP